MSVAAELPTEPLKKPIEDNPVAATERLQVRLIELEELLSALDNLIEPLTQLALNALEQADNAPTFEERTRYEQLYLETSARLGELNAIRDRLRTQMDELAASLRTLSGEE